MKTLLAIGVATVTLCFALSGCADEDSNKAEMHRIDRDTDVAPHEPAPLDEAQQAVMNAREQRLQQNQPQ